MDIQTLNDRWQLRKQPHAVGSKGDGLFHWFCPDCGLKGEANVPLIAAMSGALAHKNRCTAVE